MSHLPLWNVLTTLDIEVILATQRQQLISLVELLRSSY
jgi:hypothetical protein